MSSTTMTCPVSNLSDVTSLDFRQMVEDRCQCVGTLLTQLLCGFSVSG